MRTKIAIWVVGILSVLFPFLVFADGTLVYTPATHTFAISGLGGGYNGISLYVLDGAGGSLTPADFSTVRHQGSNADWTDTLENWGIGSNTYFTYNATHTMIAITVTGDANIQGVDTECLASKARCLATVASLPAYFGQLDFYYQTLPASSTTSTLSAIATSTLEYGYLLMTAFVFLLSGYIMYRVMR